MDDDNVSPFHPSFYKILTHLTPTFELPLGFTNKHREILPERAELRHASGATRVVSVVQLAGDRYYFTRGWAAFSRDMKLRLHEVLVFSYVGNSTFHVCAYAVTAVEKKCINFRRPVFVESSSESESESEFLSASSESESDLEPHLPRTPLLKVVLTPSYRYRVSIPLPIAEAWGLMERARVVLEYGGGRRAEVAVVRKQWRERVMIHLSTGWRDFCKGNGMSMGNAYSLTFLPSVNVIRVRRARNTSCTTFFRRR